MSWLTPANSEATTVSKVVEDTDHYTDEAT